MKKVTFQIIFNFLLIDSVLFIPEINVKKKKNLILIWLVYLQDWIVLFSTSSKEDI